ncbi:MAG: hypothetical protein LBL95_04815 [Deltaproteobacteria bacterium]|nr:hypothetical protein [Deltaproteobacteria bacterium]
MIENEYYFILHAPRQTGKTTYLNFLTNKINRDGRWYALNCSLAGLRGISDRGEAMTTVVSQINVAMTRSLVTTIREKAFTYDSLPGMKAPDFKVATILNHLCRDLERDLVVFFDEADLLSGHGLISFLAQVRDGYLYRDETVNRFPRSMALVGMRDIRDYLIKVRPDDESTGEGSPFNVKKESLTLPNFTKDEIRTLYGQHSGATGQYFDDSAIERAWDWTEGQPWLVNALADEIVSGQLKNDYRPDITGGHFDQAAATLIKGRSTHVGSLLARLREPRVIKVMDAVFAGLKGTVSINSDDRKLCLDLGLLSENEDRTLRPSNKIYGEVMSRTLTDEIQHVLDIDVGPKKWTDGQFLLMSGLLKEFQRFWRQGSDSFPFRHKDFAAFKYDEATYSFMLLAYLQKIVNSGGLVFRQYAEGRGAVDIGVRYGGHEYLVEVKLKGEKTLDDWQRQLAGYLDAAGQKEGWLVIFDRDRNKAWEEKIYWEDALFADKVLHLVGC